MYNYIESKPKYPIDVVSYDENIQQTNQLFNLYKFTSKVYKLFHLINNIPLKITAVYLDRVQRIV